MDGKEGSVDKDGEISEIFLKKNIINDKSKFPNILKRLTPIKKKIKIIKKLPESERLYHPNYNSIRPHSQVCIFKSRNEHKPIYLKNLFHQKLCSKYEKHQNQNNFNDKNKSTNSNTISKSIYDSRNSSCFMLNEISNVSFLKQSYIEQNHE